MAELSPQFRDLRDWILRQAEDIRRDARAESLADVHSKFMDQAEILEAKSISGSELPTAHEMLEKLIGIVWGMLREAEESGVESEAP